MIRIAVTAPKGGVGKTFVACNLAFYIEESRIQVHPCMIDFGAQASASRYLDQPGYQNARNLHHDDFVFRASSGLVVASCQDWDKADESSAKRQAFEEIMTNPLANSKVLERNLNDYQLVQECDGFIYDTDHYVRTFIRFLGGFDRVILIYDEREQENMENLAMSWIPYSNFHAGGLVKKRPRKTFILANRTNDLQRARQRLMKCCERVFMNELPRNDVSAKLEEIQQFCVADFAIPAFRSSATERSKQKSLPIWSYDESGKDPFRQLAALVR